MLTDSLVIVIAASVTKHGHASQLQLDNLLTQVPGGILKLAYINLLFHRFNNFNVGFVIIIGIVGSFLSDPLFADDVSLAELYCSCETKNMSDQVFSFFFRTHQILLR